MKRFCLIVLGVLAATCLSCAHEQDLRKSKKEPLVRPVTFPFFHYLTDTRQEPALIAFNPTEYDPRPGVFRKIPSSASIRDDLMALLPAFDGLILYAFDEDVTPRILTEAEKLGFSGVVLGIWNPASEEELAGTAELVKRYLPSLSIAVCLGNEGIMFNRYTLNDLKKASRRLKELLDGLPVPICTTESLSQYSDRELWRYGDFLAPNIHPVFDHPNVDPENSAEWARKLARALAEESGMPVLVKETGFPHGGAPLYTPQSQKRFWEAYTSPGRLTRLPEQPDVWVSYAAAFESYDLPWKAAQTNLPIEKEWGLLSTEREAYPAFYVWVNPREKKR